MEAILSFAQKATPLMILGVAVVSLAFVIIQLVKGKDLLESIRGTQKEKYPKMEEHYSQIETLIRQNETLLNNHFKHEIPEMVSSLSKIEGIVGGIQTEQQSQGQRLTRVETLVEVLRGK